MALTIDDERISSNLAELAEVGLEVMALAGSAREWDEYLLDDLIDRLTQGAEDVGLPGLTDRGAWESLVRE